MYVCLMYVFVYNVPFSRRPNKLKNSKQYHQKLVLLFFFFFYRINLNFDHSRLCLSVYVFIHISVEPHTCLWKRICVCLFTSTNTMEHFVNYRIFIVWNSSGKSMDNLLMCAMAWIEFKLKRKQMKKKKMLMNCYNGPRDRKKERERSQFIIK